MKIEKPLMDQINELAEVAGFLHQKGWAERNAGNISVNIRAINENKTMDFSGCQRILLPKAYPALQGNIFIISGAGTRMKDLAKQPENNICFLRIADQGTHYQILQEKLNKPYIKPSSELLTHLAIHQMLVSNESEAKAVLHTHVDELIALSQIKDFNNEEKLSRLIWGMLPEAITFLPEGIGLVPYQLPGSEKIAIQSIKALKHHKLIIWQKHGCMAVGKDVNDAFDKIDIAAKSARIYFLCKNAGYEPEGLSDVQIEKLRKNVPI